MDFDFSTILYILFGLLYFIFTASKKRKAPKHTPSSSQPDRRADTLGPPPARQTTFEELLEEFTGKRKQVVSEVKEEIREIKSDLKPVVQSYSDRRTAQKERGTNLMESKNRQPKPLELSFEENEEVEKEDYAGLLREPDGARKAFIMSEIFNRKY